MSAPGLYYRNLLSRRNPGARVSLPLFYTIDIRITHYSEQPCPTIGSLLEFTPEPIRFKVGFLQKVVGILGIAGQPEGIAVQDIHMRDGLALEFFVFLPGLRVVYWGCEKHSFYMSDGQSARRHIIYDTA
jgi:hypothetical protein